MTPGLVPYTGLMPIEIYVDHKVTPLPSAGASRELQVERALDMISNHRDVRHHPPPISRPWLCPAEGRRPARLADAGRQALRGADNLQGGLRLRAGGRLEKDVTGSVES
jgi:hypothetical protein